MTACKLQVTEEESRTQDSTPRPSTALPRTDPLRPRTEMLEAKDTSASALEKKDLKNFFSGNLQKKTFSK